MTKHKGFTLIELMIVVAIIGILSMFSIPFYKTYVKKTRVSEALNIFTPIKIAVIENHAIAGHAAAEDFIALGFSANALYNGDTKMLAMSAPLTHVKIETAKYDGLAEDINRFTLYFNEAFDKVHNELVIEMYPGEINKTTKKTTNASYKTLCVSYLKTRPQNAIEVQFLPRPCKASTER